MDIGKLKKISLNAELVYIEINKLLTQHVAVQAALKNISHIQENAGKMFFTGESGKMNEEDIIGTVNIGAIAGYAEVPVLLRKLAYEKKGKIEAKMQVIIDNHTKLY